MAVDVKSPVTLGEQSCMKKPLLLTRYEKSTLAKRSYSANKTSLSNLEFSMSVIEQVIAGRQLKDFVEDFGTSYASLGEVLIKFLRITRVGSKFRKSNYSITGVLRDEEIRSALKTELAEVRDYLNHIGKTEKPAVVEEAVEPSKRWTPELAMIIHRTNNVRHILGGGDKDRVHIEEMMMVKRYALGEQPHDLAESYGIGIGTVRTRMERGWKRMTGGMDFDTVFMREHPQEVRIVADNAIFAKLNHIKIEALSDAQAEVVEMRTNLDELVQQKAMVETELSSQYKELCQANVEKEDLITQLQSVNGQLAGTRAAYESTQALLNNARTKVSELERRLEASQLAQLHTRPESVTKDMPKPSRPPRGIFARIRHVFN